MSKPKPQGPSITTQRMKELMEEQGHTQESLAEILHVSSQTVHRWVNGKSNIGKNLDNVAEALNTTTEYLLGVRYAFKNRSDEEKYRAMSYAYDDDIPDEALIENEKELAEKDKQRRTIRNRFFAFDLGYVYNDYSDVAAAIGDRFCTLTDQQGEEYDFTFEEFQQLLSQIKEKVDYACFKKRNTVRDCGGMKPIDPLERR